MNCVPTVIGCYVLRLYWLKICFDCYVILQLVSKLITKLSTLSFEDVEGLTERFSVFDHIHGRLKMFDIYNG